MFGMTPSLIRNLLAPKSTRRYPNEVRPAFEGTRGDLERDAARCTYCGVCAAKCPSQCLRVKKATAIWQHDPSACVFCGTCVEACPEDCLRHIERPRPPFAAGKQSSPA